MQELPNPCILLTQANIESLLHVNVSVISPPISPALQAIEPLASVFAAREFLEAQLQSLQDNEFRHLTDHFNCHYVAMKIDQVIILVGPYLNEAPDRNHASKLLASNHLALSLLMPLLKYFSFIPLCEDLPIFKALQNLDKIMTRSQTTRVYQHYQHYPTDQIAQSFSPQESHFETMKLVENSYVLEDKLLVAVAEGNSQEAILHLSDLIRTGARLNRTGERVRDERNLCIVLNSLLRKTVQQVGVHPIYLDATSGEFARSIEQCKTVAEVERLRVQMVRTYCELVNRLNLKAFSIPIRKALNYINLNLSKTITVKEIAAEIDCSPHYLSTIFNKELNQSISDYIHSHRLKEAAELLRKTNLSVQHIATYVGYSDTNYFTRLFHKLYGKTPSQHRKELKP
ncbi:MAG: AraC family transcriptional regulator [Eubacteriales bacterium]|nr:AraC family transcriptional regulator [Eubacteriales bacterium]